MNNFPLTISSASSASPLRAQQEDPSVTGDGSFGNLLARQMNEQPDDNVASATLQHGEQNAYDRVDANKEMNAIAEDSSGMPAIAASEPGDPALLAALLQFSTAQTEAFRLRSENSAGEYPELATGTASMEDSTLPISLASRKAGNTRADPWLTPSPQQSTDRDIPENILTFTDGFDQAAHNQGPHVIQDGALSGMIPGTTSALTTQPPLQPGLPSLIQTPLSHPSWSDEFGQKISWFAGQHMQNAELHLNPPNLGPIDVTLQMKGDQATAIFSSPHPQVREAIENSLNKLREILAESGIMLGNASVHDQSKQPPERAANTQNPQSDSAEPEVSSILLHDSKQTVARKHHGLVDTFV